MQELPSIFEGNDKYNDLRGKKLQMNLKLNTLSKVAVMNINVYLIFKQRTLNILFYVNFPDAIDIEDPYDAEQASLTDLKHWENNPANLAMLEKIMYNFVLLQLI